MKVIRRADNKEMNVKTRQSILGLFTPISTELSLASNYLQSVIEKYKDKKLQPSDIYYAEHEQECDDLAQRYPNCYEYKIVKEKVWKQKVDSNGNPMYEDKEETSIDENGNTITQRVRYKLMEKVMEKLRDENGNVVRDQDGKIIMVQKEVEKIKCIPYEVSYYQKRKLKDNPSYRSEIADWLVDGYDQEVSDDLFDVPVHNEYYTKFITEDDNFIALFNALHPIYFLEK